MRTSRFLCSGVLFVCFTLPASAQESKKSAEPISLDNVSKVGLLSTVKNDALFLDNGPGENELILVSRNSTTIVDDKTLNLLREMDESQSKGLTFSKDRSLVSWFEDGKTIIRDEKSGATVPLDAGKEPVSAAFSPDHRLIAVGEAVTTDPSTEGSGYSVVRVFETATGKLIHTLDTGHDGYGAVRPVFSPDGKVLAVSNRNFETRIFDVATGKPLHVLPKRMTQEIAFSPDGKTLAAAYVDGKLGLWEIETGRELHMVDSGCAELFSVAWNSTGDLLATCGPSGGKQIGNTFSRLPGKVLLWNAKAFTIAKELMEVQWSGRVRFSHDETRIIATVKEMRTLDDSPRLVVWSTDAAVALPTASKVQIPLRAVRQSLALPPLAMPTIAVSPDGGTVYSPLNNDGELAMWDPTTGHQGLVFKGKYGWQISRVRISPDGSKVATASLDKTAKLWNAKTGELLATMEGQNDRLIDLTYSPSGKYIVTSTGKQWPYSPKGPVSAWIWDAATGRQIAEFKSHMDTLRATRFSPDEKYVLTSSDDHTARLWEAATGKDVHVFSHNSSIISIAFSPDGQKILTASAGWKSQYVEGNPQPPAPSVKLWDAATGKLLIETPSLQGVTAAFSESGDQIVTASRGLIKFFDTESGKELATC